MQDTRTKALVAKYNQPIPRYTSYPTVPFWKEGIDRDIWRESVRAGLDDTGRSEGISIYIHLPFCESLCTYCGCNKKITTNHQVEGEYLEALRREISLYLAHFNHRPVIRELHLGGGTPTFFSPGNLEYLVDVLHTGMDFHPDREFSIEGHPNNTTREHLAILQSLGFRRISYGVQDNDAEVQRLINRVQPFENVEAATRMAREAGFTSVNFDLIYGLPGQNLQTLTRSFEQVLTLKPDRIAFYSYAHVPWTSRGQRLFDESNLPSAEEKLQLYLHGRDMLTDAGYEDIGMDHFALPEDGLFKAWKDGSLHRNFMGYTTQKTSLLLGLGVSAISDTGNAFAQNQKTLGDYYENIRQGQLPVFRGYFLDEEDLAFRQYILDIACRSRTDFREQDLHLVETYSMDHLKQLETDGLIELQDRGLQVTREGRHFIRNICSAFDLHLQRNGRESAGKRFSQAI